ncbi:MAG: amidohydrolase [Fibrobacter sp.]|nr:amidohydrolase [Fibrobacter sp.]
MQEAKTFYDIHLHAMDLSHPNILAFVKRVNGIGLKLVMGGIFLPFLKRKKENILNLLSVMENNIEDYFILMEYYLKNKSRIVKNDNSFSIDGVIYNRIVLTPLLMDFGYKNIKTESFYDIPPQKSIVEQTYDVLKAIKKYCSCYLEKGVNGKVETKKRTEKNDLLFEIYPFLGINTQNYEKEKLVTMMEKYFGKYEGKRNDLFENMGKFDGGIDLTGSNVFAGIKLYPPLGFDPWPKRNRKEMDKVLWLYGFCEEKNIPLTAHCSGEGFIVDNKTNRRTTPKKWAAVLQRYPNLKLNLAHLGYRKNDFFFFQNKKWLNEVLKLIKEYENVYTDFSCAAFDDNYYGWLSKLISENKVYSDKMLFGSDYMINLLSSKSYNYYLNTFFKTQKIEKPVKEKICTINPERFLFEDNK